MKRVLLFFFSFLLILSFCTSCAGSIDMEILENASIGVLAGTSSVRYAEQHGSVHEYNTREELTAALKSGTVTCAILDTEDVAYFTRFNLGVKVLSKHMADSRLRIAAAKECPDLIDDFNTALAYLKDEKILQKIIRGHYENHDYSYETVMPKKAKTLTCVIGTEFIPYRYNGENGEPEGIDIDLAKAICAYLGYDVVFISAENDVEMFRLICDGTAHFAIGGITETAVDDNFCIYTDSYATCSQVVAVRR